MLELLNRIQPAQDDPRLIRLIRDHFLEPPSTQPYNLLNPQRSDYSEFGQTGIIQKYLNNMVWVILWYFGDARLQKVLSEGLQLCQRFFLLCFSWWEEYQHKQNIIDPPAKRHYVLRWRADVGPILIALWFFRGSGPVLLGTFFFLIFQGEAGVQAPVLPLDPCMLVLSHIRKNLL